MARAAVVVTARRKASPSRRALRRVARTRLISGLVGQRRFFRFQRPIAVSEWTADGLWFARCDLLGIHAFGESCQEAWEAFIELFEADWDLVAREKSARLTSGARKLKQSYLELVDSVEPVL